MLTVRDVLDRLDSWAPFASAASWDPVGLQVGDSAAEVTAAGVCHEVTQNVVDEAIAGACSLLVTYHPLLFRPTSRVVAGSGPAGHVHRLIRGGVSVIAAHTNVDAAPGGTSDALAEALGLSDIRPFGGVEGPARIKVVVFVPAGSVVQVRNAMANAGAGTIGLYESCSFETQGTGRFEPVSGAEPAVGAVGADNAVEELRLEMVAPSTSEAAVVGAAIEAHPYGEPAIDVYDVRDAGTMIGRVGAVTSPVRVAELAETVADVLDGPPIRVAAATSDPVSRVAVVPGAGADLASAAVAAGAEVLVTGDARHHATVAANRSGLSVIDATHEATERPGMRALYRAVSDIVSAIDLTTINTNPWSASP